MASLALLAASAHAQFTIVANSNNPSVVTVSYQLCPTATGSVTTITGSVTQTYGGGSTVYETVYPTFCSTGLQDVTYTVTEGCPCTADRPAGYIPQGFTTTVATCTTCGEQTLTETLTCPIATTAPGSPAGSAPAAITGAAAPGSGATPGSAAAPGAAAGNGAPGSAPVADAGAGAPAGGSAAAAPAAGGTPAAGGAAAPGGNNRVGGAAASGGAMGCPGPNCASYGSNSTTPGAAGAGAPGSASGAALPASSVARFTGAASSLSPVGTGLSILAGLIGVIAWRL